ncbi:MAG: VOC family protein [Christensenellales bacterium]
MQKIQVHLWYDTQAAQAAEYYTSIFPGSSIDARSVIRDTPSGDAEMLSFTLAGVSFQAISGGPQFKLNPSLSLSVMCGSLNEVNTYWNKLIAGGKALMPLDRYPFSKRYGWLEDKFGLTWQIMHSAQPITQKIVPNLLFSGGQAGLAGEALRFYAETFENAQISHMNLYRAGEVPNPQAGVKHAAFTLEGLQMTAMDNAMAADFVFNEAASLIVSCADQAEIDRLWARLSASPEHEACGWLKDKFGLSWQIVPEEMGSLMCDAQGELLPPVVQAMLQMKKLDIKALREARGGH